MRRTNTVKIEELSLFSNEVANNETTIQVKKKRGRKKKQPTFPEIDINPTHEIVAQQAIGLFELSQESFFGDIIEDNPPKKKRGRKKKKVNQENNVEEDAFSQYSAEEIEKEIEELEEVNLEEDTSACIVGLGNLFKESNNFKVLSREEEYDYFMQYRNNPTEELKQFLICSNIKLAISVAKTVSKVTNKIPFEDMIDEGVIGLMKAIDKFDVTRGYKFSTYAYPWIKQAITRFIANCGDMIRVPVHFSDNMNKIRHFENSYMLEHNCDKVDDNITAKALKLSEEKVKKYKKATQPCSSLDSTVDDTETSIIDLVGDTMSNNPEKTVMNNTLHDLLMEAINSLDEREAFIIVNRFNLDENKNPLSLADIAKKYGLTKERIRQIEASAIAKLRHPSKSNKYRPFYE